MSTSIWDEYVPEVEVYEVTSPPEVDDGKPSQATALVRLAEAKYDIGLSTDDDVFCVPKSGPQVVRQLRGNGGLRPELASAYFAEFGRAASGQALADALAVLEGKARSLNPMRLAMRVAMDDGSSVLDIGDATGRAVIITPGGWRIEDRAPVLFRRSAVVDALATPERGGSWDDLWSMVNVAEVDRPLIIAWLVAALLPDIPHPVLLFAGEQGTGKSTAMRYLTELVDPSRASTRSQPRDAAQWIITASASYVVPIDNVSTIPPWLSDSLCKAVTGDGDIRRRLYSDGDLAVFSFRRVIMLNGIDVGSMRGDLAERILMIDLARIKGTRRLTEAQLGEQWARVRPRVIGSLLDTACEVLRVLPSVSLSTTARPRMADFACVLAAVDTVTGTAGTERYVGRAETLAQDSVLANPVGQALAGYILKRFDGSAAELLDLLMPWKHAHELSYSREWPTSAAQLTGIIKRLAPAMRQSGWIVEDSQDRHEKVKRWTLVAPSHRVQQESFPATPATPAHFDGGTAGSAGMNSHQSPNVQQQHCSVCHDLLIEDLLDDGMHASCGGAA